MTANFYHVRELAGEIIMTPDEHEEEEDGDGQDGRVHDGTGCKQATC